jgi:hypothetical protein
VLAKPRGATPTTVIDWPFTSMVLLSTLGLAPRRVVQ